MQLIIFGEMRLAIKGLGMVGRMALIRSVGLAALAVVVAAVYWPGLSGPFIFDDFPALVDNSRVHVEALGFGELWRAAFSFDPGGTGRQLAMLSFSLNYALDGLNPWGWKLGGLLVHLVNTILVYALCVRLLALAGVGRLLRWSAAAIALLWAVHPLQVSTVLYVVQRMETLSLMFVLLALLAYLRGRQAQIQGARGWVWLALCAPLLLMALGAKETALLLPLYTLALELTLLRFDGYTSAQKRFWRWGYAIGCLIVLVVFVAVVIPAYTAPQAYAIRDFTAGERVLTQLRVLPMYLGQILFPSPALMSFYYDDLQASRGLFEPITTIAGALLLLALFAVAWIFRRRAPLFSLGLLWFFVSHAITSNVLALELVFEHRNYFAILGILLAAADLVRRIPVRDGPGIKIAAVAALVLGVGFLGVVRAATWGNVLLLSTELTHVNPDSARAAQDLGILYNAMSDGDVDSPFFGFAVAELERESKMDWATVLAEQSLILLHAENNLPVKPEWWSRLQFRLRDRPIGHETVGAMFRLLDRRMAGVRMDDSALSSAFDMLFERKPMPPYSYGAVALHALKYQNDTARAKRLLVRAVDGAAPYPGYLQSLSERLREGGNSDVADWLDIEAAKSRKLQ
ncbi:hypothetical protein ABE493_06405 [Stenotrophomonas terrae]|uniref:hypothetical protein n=1 Tax=Stenotrophomonas terrae TaxID=405446 RepID=UPI00320918A6